MRYLRLYLYFIRFAFSRAMEFRFDFFFRIAMDIVYYIVNILFFEIIYLHTDMLGGWTLDQVIVFTTAFLFVDAMYMTFFSTGLWHLPFCINNGELDYYLTRPVSSLFFLTTREFAANSFLNLLMAIGLVAWALWRYPGEIGILSFGVFVLLLIAGSALHAILAVIFLIPTFWLHSSEGLRSIYYTIAEYGQRPHLIFTGWIRRSIMTVIPVALIASVPTQLLFTGPDAEVLLQIAGVFVAFCLILRWFWRRGLRAYSSASS